MEDMQEVLKDSLISQFLSRFPKDEWNSVLTETLKLGIHSMNTVQTLSVLNVSPAKPLKPLNLELFPDDDSTDFVNDSIIKVEKTTPSVKEDKKIVRNDSKLPQKKKKTLSQVNKETISRTTPKGRKVKIEFFNEKKNSARVHSMKSKKRVNLRMETGKKAEEKVKSFKNLRTGVKDVGSPKGIRAAGVKGSMCINDFQELYRGTMSCTHKKVQFPLKAKSEPFDPYQYVTSSSDEPNP